MGGGLRHIKTCRNVPLQVNFLHNDIDIAFYESNRSTHGYRSEDGGRGPQTNKNLPQSPFTGQCFYVTTFGIAFYQSNLSTHGYMGVGMGGGGWLAQGL
jgi:hypothetical protein